MNPRIKEGNFPSCKFSCTICADCCRDAPYHRRKILMLRGEALEISDEIGRPEKAFALRSNKSGPYEFKMRKLGGKCVFLKEDDLCAIYENRPLVCRFFPFELKADGTWGVSGGCEGIGLGRKVPKSFFSGLKKIAEGRFSENDRD